MKHYCVHKILALLLVAVGYATSSWGQNVAKVGTTEYATLSKAITAAASATDKTVTLIADVTLTKKVTIKGDIALDLNGYSIHAYNSDIKNIQVSGKLTLKDNKENSTGRIYGDTHYSSGTYNATLIKVLDGGEFVMESGHIYAVLDDAANNGHFAIGVWGTGKVTINGGTVEAGWYALAGNGAEKKSTTFTINGGTLISTADYAIYHPQDGKFIVNGGTIYGEAGAIAMKRGELEINGGTITSKGKGDTGTWGDGTGNLGNAALNFCNMNGNVTATIKGGTITAEGDAVVVDAQTEPDKTLDLSLLGGTFSSDVSSFIDENSVVTKNEADGTYTVSTYCAQIVGGQKYTTLQEAFDNVTADNNTIRLLNDIDDFGVVTLTKKATIFMRDNDGNPHTAKGTVIYVKGTDADLCIGSSAGSTDVEVSQDGNYTVTYANNVGKFSLSDGIRVEEGGKATLYAGMVESTKGTAFRAYGNSTGSGDAVASTVNIAGGYVRAQEGCVYVCGKGATTDISGGAVLESLDNAVISGNGTSNYGGTSITIKKCTIIGRIQTPGYAACGIYHPQEGTLSVSYGNALQSKAAQIIAINGAGIVMRGGILDFKGGYVIATGDKDFKGKVGDAREVVGTSAIVYDQNQGYYDANNVKIDIAPNNNVYAVLKGSCAAIEVVNEENTTNIDHIITVQHGTFSSDVSKFCVDGYTATPNADGTYGISEVGDGMVVYADSYEDLVAGGSVTIDMDKVEKMLLTADVADVEVSLARTYNNTGWHAISLPFSVTLTADMTAQFGFAKLYNLSLNESEAPIITFKTLQTGDELPAGLPCLIKSNTTGTQTLAVGKVNIQKDVMKAPTCTSIEEIYTFYPVLQNTYTADRYGYLLYSGEPSTFAYNQNASAYVQPLRYYMTIQHKRDGSYILPTQSGAQKVRLQVIGDGEATGITDIDTDSKAAQGKVYNLQGVQVSTSTEGLPSGIYIQNGRKIIVK